MKNKSIMSFAEEFPPSYYGLDFRVVRSEYVQRKLGLLRKAYLHSLKVVSDGDFIEALLCFHFLKNELDAVISSADSRCFVSASDLVISIQDYISLCNQRILELRKSSCQ
ncbi:hypothetical protein HZX00_004345 [Salmonella enterica]|nr:hypothetical protein [Salmonella enterica]